MKSPAQWRGGRLLIAGVVSVSWLPAVAGWQAAQSADDPNLAAIPYPRVRLVGTRDVHAAGGTAHLRATDPLLLYQLGRDLVQRQFTLRDGAYGRAGDLTVPLYATAARHATAAPLAAREARFARDHTNSCGMCHSMPALEPGAGQTIASTSGQGRNTPHFFGAGLVEMLGEQVRALILARYDRNRNGAIDRVEVRASSPVRIPPRIGASPVDYGDLAPDANGVPQLNAIFRIWYLDSCLHVIADATTLNDPRVAAFDFAMQPFGWGRGSRVAPDGTRVSEGAEASTLRGIYSLAADVHMGLQAHDPVQRGLRPDGRAIDADAIGADEATTGGVASRSLSGALQFDFRHATDIGRTRSSQGVSLDDPDGDGVVSELTAGDIDAAEFYLLHTTAPVSPVAPGNVEGRRRLRELGCVRCHVESWRLQARDDRLGLTGDRRLFRLEVTSVPSSDGSRTLRGRFLWTSRLSASGTRVPLGRAVLIERIYSDFKHWDLGPAFHERRFDGSVQREHRTAPLWGVASSAPYGHAGQFGSLDDVIRAHGGAAAREVAGYRALPASARAALLAYLDTLELSATEHVPADIDGDGRIAASFRVAGIDVGYERFDPRWLFRVPPKLRILYRVPDHEGRTVPLAQIANVRETYGLDLPFRRDADGNAFADVEDMDRDRPIRR